MLAQAGKVCAIPCLLLLFFRIIIVVVVVVVIIIIVVVIITILMHPPPSLVLSDEDESADKARKRKKSAEKKTASLLVYLAYLVQLHGAGRVLAQTRPSEEEGAPAVDACPVKALADAPPALAAHLIQQFVEVQKDTKLPGSAAASRG